jgi:3-(3-hydroxy-phenyl)propionate hydroxylase
MNDQDQLWDVIIVGCGPVGATAANLLGQAGHKVLVLDQFVDAFPLPRAVHIDHEMMRLFQGLGLADKVRAQSRETQGHMHLGADGDVIRYMGSIDKPRRFGWANDYFFYQPELEATLRESFKRFANIRFRQGTKVTHVRNLAEGCEVLSEGETFRARYVIGCDGARSPVRESLGIVLDDLKFEEAWLVVDANVEGPVSFQPIPGLPVGADVQQLSVMTCDPKRPATIVPGRGLHRRWEFMLLPGESEAAIVEPQSIEALVGPWLKGCKYEIIRTATYRFNARVAHQWQKGRVFLAGDAAHQTPPFFGQGMCHGLRDVSNLSFKLDLVLRSLADETLLATYQAERDPQVRHVIGAAVAAGRYICELDPAKAVARDAEIRERQRSGQDIATAADLIAPYRTGLVADEAGERFIQPRVATPEGRTVLLDEATGSGFVLISQRPDPLEDLSSDAIDVMQALQIKRVVVGLNEDFTDAEGHLTAVFQARKASAVLLRPDHYVYGWVTESVSLERLLLQLQTHLFPQNTKARIHA